MIKAAERSSKTSGQLLLVVVMVLLGTVRTGRSACSTVLLKREGTLLLGHNLDETTDFDGFLCVNKRDTYKVGSTLGALRTYSKDLPHSLAWISKYGSITWSSKGRDLPDAGINEAGLAIEEMSLSGHHYPFGRIRPRLFQMQWIQYHLDSFSTVEDVIKSASLVIPDGWSWHFFVADKSGKCASLEYIDNKLVVHTGKNMSVTALCNAPYAEELNWLRKYKGFGGRKRVDLSDKNIPRFVRAGQMLKTYDPQVHSSAVDYMFGILENLGSRFTRRSYVVDMRRRIVYFRTDSHSEMRHFSFKSFDFSCDTPVHILDLNARYSGDVTDKFRKYTYDENRRISESWVNHVIRMYPGGSQEDRIEAGLTPEHIDRYARYPESSLMKSDLQMPPNRYGLTELHWAAYQGDLQKVVTLLNNGGQVDARTGKGTTALMAAAQSGHLEVAECLMGSGADVNAADGSGDTALIAAVIFGHSDIATLLIHKGANVRGSNGTGLGAIHYAACNGDLTALELLLDSGVDPDASSRTSFNALMSAAQSGQLGAAEYLVSRGADIGVVDENGNSALLISLLLRHSHIAELLIKSGADVLGQNKEGITPWKAASELKDKGILKLLRDKGAKPKRFLGIF